MNRQYNNITTNTAKFFIGNEVEHTPAYGLKTLFVVGNQTIEAVHYRLDAEEDVTHIFFGANHSFNPNTPGAWIDWNHIIEHFLKLGKQCSLDIPFTVVNDFNNKTNLCSYSNFIPQIRIPVANIKDWSYNTMIKLDDIDFNATNPGVWTHNLKALQNDDVFTSWTDYNNDNIIK
jgi:hypothetical protein